MTGIWASTDMPRQGKREPEDAPPALSVQWQSLDIPIQGKERAIRGHHRAMRWQKGQPDDVAAAEHHLGFPLRRQANDAAFAAQRCRHVQIPLTIERQALWATQPSKEHTHFTSGRNPIHALEARCGWPGHEKLPRRTESQVIRRKRWLQRRKNKYLA